MKYKVNPNSLVGKAFDHVDYHCYSFIEECLDVPRLDEVAVSTARNDIHKHKGLFELIEHPEDYCIVLLGDSHVGIYYNNGIYHNDICGVRYESMRVMKLKYNKVVYYGICKD